MKISEESIAWLRFRARVVAISDPKSSHALQEIANECSKVNRGVAQTEAFIKGLAGNLQAFAKTEFD